MPTAAIYARVSTDRQAEQGYSIETQIAACEKYARDLGASTVTQFVDDGYSGAYLDRPRLDALRDALRAKIYDVVIVYTPDRLARRLSHQLLLTEEIEKAGAALHFVNQEYKATPEGQLFLQIQGAFAEYEREKIRERTMRGMRGKLKSGKPLRNQHVIGYDFKYGQYIINSIESKTVQQIFNMYISSGVGTDEIARRLTEMRIPSPSKLTHWQGASVHRILRNQMYTGEYFALRKVSTKTGAHSRKLSPRSKEEWIPLKCPQIIDAETFAAAQNLLDTNKTQLKRTKDNGVYLLQGLMRCAKCGEKIILTNNRAGRFYACYAHSKRKAAGHTCDARFAKTDIVDNAFWATLRNICSSEKRLAAYIKRTGKTISTKTDTAALKARLAKIEEEKVAVVDWYTNGLLTQQATTDKLSALTSEAKAISAKLAQPDKEKAVDTARIYNIIHNCGDNPENKRNAVRSVIDKIIYERTDGEKKPKAYSISFVIYFK